MCVQINKNKLDKNKLSENISDDVFSKHLSLNYF